MTNAISTHLEEISSEVAASFRCRLLDLEPVGQKCEMWCWAASTEMIMRYLRGKRDPRNDIEQGRQMNRKLGDAVVDCTSIKTAEEYEVCNGRGGWPYFFEFEDVVQSTKWSSRRHVLEERGIALDGGHRVRVKGRLTSRQLRALTYESGRRFKQQLDEEEDCALGWEMLKAQLDGNRPVFFTYRFPTRSGGHMTVAAGYAITPGAKRWVIVADPLPPGSGDTYMIPYEYYVAGPYGRHWRDYWIPSADDQAAGLLGLGDGLPRRRRIDDLEFGTQLVSSGAAVPERRRKNKGEKKARRRGHRLTEEEIAAARPAAEEGLAAVAAVAEGAPTVAAGLGMGNLLQYLVRAIFNHLSGDDTQVEPAAEAVPHGQLRLGPEPLPVYELTRKNLLKWRGGDVWNLLAAPREMIWEVNLPTSRPFPFFAAVTVRRFDDVWKLFSVGRSKLMLTLLMNRLVSVDVWSRVASFADVVDILSALGILDVLVARMKDDEIRAAVKELGLARDGSDAETRSGYTEDEVEAFLEERRKSGRKPDKQRLKRAIRLQHGSGSDLAREIVVDKPQFILDVRELYQLFVAYSDDRLEPVYLSDFYRPGNRVTAGSKREVLANLRKVAKGVGV